MIVCIIDLPTIRSNYLAVIFLNLCSITHFLNVIDWLSIVVVVIFSSSISV